MFHGETNFGFANGANYYDCLTPDTTSYDYDAPLSEREMLLKKYKTFQTIIKKYLLAAETFLPKKAKQIHYGKWTVQQKTSLFSTRKFSLSGKNGLYHLYEKIRSKRWIY